MKKYLLLLALLAGCNFAFTACSDDDDNADEIDTEDVFSEEAMAAYCALNQLCGIEELPSNWQTFTAEPTYGYSFDASNPYVRTVYIDDIMEAEDCFRSLGGTIESGQASATYTAGNISYQYTAKNQSDLLATIDCNVPQVPHLTQIRFVPSEVQEENGLFGFTWDKTRSQDDIYYSVGDVVYDEDEKAFWVCVRPAIYGEKHKTYWVAICADKKAAESKLFEGCFYKIEENSKHGEYTVPTKLGTDVTSFKHLAILLNAVTNPNRYGAEAKKYGFGAGKKLTNVDQEYFKKLAQYWEKRNIYSALGILAGQEYYNQGFLMFYKGYSSWGKTMTLWTVKSNGLKTGENNAIVPDKNFEEIKLNWDLACQYDVEYKHEFDIRRYLNNGEYKREYNKYFDANHLAKLFNMEISEVEHGFLVKDRCYEDPYSALPGNTTDSLRMRYLIAKEKELNQ